MVFITDYETDIPGLTITSENIKASTSSTIWRSLLEELDALEVSIILTHFISPDVELSSAFTLVNTALNGCG